MRAVPQVLAVLALLAASSSGQLVSCTAKVCVANSVERTDEFCLRACNTDDAANDCKMFCTCGSTSPGYMCANVCRKAKTSDECGTPVFQKCQADALACDRSPVTSPAPTTAAASTPAPTSAPTTAPTNAPTTAPTTAPATPSPSTAGPSPSPSPSTAAPTTTPTNVPTTNAPTTNAPTTTQSSTTSPAPTTGGSSTPAPTASTPAPTTKVSASPTPSANGTAVPGPSSTPTTPAVTSKNESTPATTAPVNNGTVLPTTTAAPTTSTPNAPSGKCSMISVVADATYCIDGPVCGGEHGGCPKKGDVATAHCLKGLDSYVSADKCIAPMDATCEMIAPHVRGCVFDKKKAAAEANANASCIPVGVSGDATYCVPGPICGGNGSNCPKKGDKAASDCVAGIPSFHSAGSCVAPADAVCQMVARGVNGCVFPSQS
ncbi:hypothetical protein SDRG_06751 [Saprolegnia diclina VS20]|uniref:Uncharacterized protein n=1 Tax=Saprolegnia diclina (strain VS20) TaxID=1156394 RepID=T0RUC8_SAPDV|nr:hypothetical protein SDRG_06751 [Saprolegnia diclina VS20]EQC36013.1 hypothetical protein SDRG_06751 [Saprolegnia diclina VS20]|eukprot:XP_008610775.1 hypothetical protein SDRG_06751 [Saprolegnia diclina VS20]